MSYVTLAEALEDEGLSKIQADGCRGKISGVWIP
jgi:hypothetical protein